MTVRQLRAELQNLVTSFGGACGIFIKEVSSGESLEVNQNDSFVAASIIKLPILWELYRQLEEGSIDARERIALNKAHQVGGCGILQALDPGLQPTVKDLGTLMIIVSDNFATNILIDRLGMDQINQTIHTIGLKKTILQRMMKDVERARQGLDNFTTAAETAALLERILQSEGRSPESCADMLAILKQQQFNDRLSAELPSEVVFAHKTGQLDGIEHDAGIFFFETGPIIAVALTRELPVNRNGAALCSAIGKMIYVHFVDKPL